MRNMQEKFEFLGNAGLATVTLKEASMGLGRLPTSSDRSRRWWLPRHLRFVFGDWGFSTFATA